MILRIGIPHCAYSPRLRCAHAALLHTLHRFVLLLLPLLLVGPLELSAQRKVRTVAGACPLTCRSMGRTDSSCREWREGQRCYVELTDDDIGQLATPTPVPAPASPTQITAPPTPTPRREAVPQVPRVMLSRERQAAIDKQREKDSCERLQQYYRSSPQIEVFEVKDAGYLNQGRYLVRGAFSGLCLTHAGYYEDGKLIKEFPVEPTRHFRRYRFEQLFHPDVSPEVRVYVIGGARSVKALQRPQR